MGTSSGLPIDMAKEIFSSPSTIGGFRLRYGRARNTGLAAVGIHPAAMQILKEFIAIGTQLKLENPGKGGIATPVDYIEPPVVRLKDGSVVRVTEESVRSVRGKVDRVLFLGDILISFGDFLYNNKPLLPPGYTEEWWAEELDATIQEKFNGSLGEASEATGIPEERLSEFLRNPLRCKPTAREALAISHGLGVPLHPAYTYFWESVTPKDVLSLRDWLLKSRINSENGDVGKN